MRRHTRPIVIVALVAALVGVFGISAGTATAAPAKGKPVVLMALGSFTGGGLDFTSVPDAAKAAAKAINKAGGINGRPIEIVVCDTKIDENLNSDCARKAVDEKMTAVVGAFSTSEEYLPILEKAGIPSVADYGISFSELTSPASFPIGATAVGGTGGMGAILADNGADKVDVPYLDLPGGAGAVAAGFVTYGLTPRGAPKATQTPVPINGADLTPSVQQTADKDPQGVALAVTDPEFSKWVLTYRQSGGEATIAGSGSSVNVDNVKTLGKAADGILISNNFKPPSLKKDPGVRQMLKEINAYDSDIKLVDASVEAWGGVHLIADALEGQTTLDGATLMAQLNQDKTWDTRIGPPINFAQQPADIKAAGGILAGLNRVFTSDVYYAKVKGGKIKAIDAQEHNFLQP
jgi:ABC-type branched-subunit amino acid transport system substrate-binding protein